jgi:hypothetical protein
MFERMCACIAYAYIHKHSSGVCMPDPTLVEPSYTCLHAQKSLSKLTSREHMSHCLARVGQQVQSACR